MYVLINQFLLKRLNHKVCVNYYPVYNIAIVCDYSLQETIKLVKAVWWFWNHSSGNHYLISFRGRELCYIAPSSISLNIWHNSSWQQSSLITEASFSGTVCHAKLHELSSNGFRISKKTFLCHFDFQTSQTTISMGT